ncbi:hypothetical protein NDN08_006759 [Rhodosorus marinus]|uniref:Uncharacterized protein n=1 Tax=Rhodosorus marinus TaxID=101924 RepID=A0AAV8UMB5_9RHOD|nr:hypothetical protein NDN08_006759 [Rhodosorus marinus]
MIEGLVKPLRKRSHTFDGPTPEELPIFQKEIQRQLEDEKAAQQADRTEKASEGKNGMDMDPPPSKPELKTKEEKVVAKEEVRVVKEEKVLVQELARKPEPENSKADEAIEPESPEEAKLKELESELKRLQARKKELYKQLKQVIERDRSKQKVRKVPAVTPRLTGKP